VCREVGERYPDVAVDDLHVDAATVHLLRRGGDFDVIVTENMFGDILADLTGELVGSLGTAPSLNCSETRAMAQAAHGSAPDIAGRDVANPVAMILSAAMLLDWLGRRSSDAQLTDAADRIDTAVRTVVRAGTCTPDLGGASSTSEFGAAVVLELSR
jgi:3-isopropylmalate dehydrogenase